MSVFKSGVGKGRTVIDYLKNDKGKEHSPPEVLRGNLQLTADLIDTLDTKWKYTSGVLAWHKEDKISPAEEQSIMDNFEKIAFAGLDVDQYNILWVRHSHEEHHHLHFVIPRVELSTGKSFNACPPNWEKHFEPFVELSNLENNWVNPNELQRQQICKPSKIDINYHRMKKLGKNITRNELDEIKDTLIDYITQKISTETIKNRNDIINSFENLGFNVHRKGKDYISIKDNESGKSLRFKGGVFCEAWRFTKENTREFGTGQKRDRTVKESVDGRIQNSNIQLTKDIVERNEHDVSILRKRVEDIYTKRKKYNQRRYREKSKTEKEYKVCDKDLFNCNIHNFVNFGTDIRWKVIDKQIPNIQSKQPKRRIISIRRRNQYISKDIRTIKNLWNKNTGISKFTMVVNSEKIQSKYFTSDRKRECDTGGINNNERNTGIYQKFIGENGKNKITEQGRDTSYFGVTKQKNSTVRKEDRRNTERTDKLETVLSQFRELVQRTIQSVQRIAREHEQDKIKKLKNKNNFLGR